MSNQHDVTSLLSAWAAGDRAALDRLSPMIYRELRRLAGRAMQGEAPGHTLQTTALVHEAFVRLVGTNVDYQGRRHFFAIAARMMRRILVDHARAKRRAKRGGGVAHLSLDEEADLAGTADDESDRVTIMDLDDALTKLAVIDARLSETVEMVYFGGLSCEETAEALCISRTTVFEDLKFAKAWLRNVIN